jgi:tripartite-type tricarboxylate transporter receptor subunit TctC
MRFLAALLLALPLSSFAQYPQHAIKMVVPFPPADIVRRIHAEVVAALKAPDPRERFAAVGAEPVGSTPEQFVERIRSDGVRWAEVIKAGNVKVQ